MKKSLLALAVFGAFATTASAQVTLYGALDAAYAKVETEENGVTTSDERGLVDGADTTAPSRWGIKVSSDLGNGLKGVAHLESQVNVTNGDHNQDDLFHRRAVVGVAGGFGTVLFGRISTPIHGVLDDTGAFGTSTIDTAQSSIDGIGYGEANGGSRRSNTINYISPNFGGISAKLQFVNQDGGASEDKTIGAAVAYENGPMMIAAGYDRTEQETDPEQVEQTSWLVGGTYDLGMAKLFAQYGNFEAEVAGDAEAQQFNIGAKVPMGAFTFLASVGRVETEVGGVDGDGTNYVLGANYNLAKTTYVYARAGSINNLDVDGGSETETTAYALGLRHAF